MTDESDVWALVLAGGEERRLHGLTQNLESGEVPRQFCSLRGGSSLLEEALDRAACIAPRDRVCAVVSAPHRVWWDGILCGMPKSNVIVQPHCRGTAHGVLLPLLRIAGRDANAVVILLPADHYVVDESVMAESLRHAARLAAANRESIYLLGARPDAPDAELGYIVPALRYHDQPARVLRFVDKPSLTRAHALLDQGALWNTLIVAASVRALLGLFGGSFAATKMAMRGLKDVALADTYQQLRSMDFATDVLRGNASQLQVLPVPHCGWSDLGTPQRVAATLRTLRYSDAGPLAREQPAVAATVKMKIAANRHDFKPASRDPVTL